MWTPAMSASPAAVTSFRSTNPGTLRPGLAHLPAPKVLLCDLDGTLIDSMPTLAELATDVMGEIYGTPRVLAHELYVATCGLPFIRQLESIFPGDGRNVAASALFEARKPSRCDRIRMSTEVERALGELKDRGIAVVVSLAGAMDLPGAPAVARESAAWWWQVLAMIIAGRMPRRSSA